MTSIQEVLAKPFFETKGVGNAIFDDGTTLSVSFKIKVFSNGTITGSLKFQSPDPKMILQLLEGISSFTLKGKSDPDKEDIIATRCFLTGISDFSEGKFSAFKVIVNPQILKTKPTTKLLFIFSLINVWQTFRVFVDTEIGELWLAHYRDIKELEQIMKLHRMSLVTSTAEISTQPDGSKSLNAIVDKATEIVQNFLKITSLAQTSWHDWAWLEVYEKTDASGEYQRIFLTFSSPKRKPPIPRGITNPAHSAHFVEAAWKGFSSLLKQYGFDVALEWYIESNLATVAESKFICATTCLEMLMDKFHSQGGREFLLEKEMFDEFYDAIKNYARDWLKDRKISKETRAAIYRAMLGLNRKQYVDKVKELLVHLGVEYSDVGITLEEIVDVRDQITHRGIYYETDEKGFRMVFKAYEGLFSILTRIFLAMLKYNEQYYDPTKQKWLRFAEVCSKI